METRYTGDYRAIDTNIAISLARQQREGKTLDQEDINFINSVRNMGPFVYAHGFDDFRVISDRPVPNYVIFTVINRQVLFEETNGEFLRKARTFGQADPKTQAFRDAVRAAGVSVTLSDMHMPQEEILRILQSPETQELLRQGWRFV